MTAYRKHESGRSMIEMVGVLAVMGLITAGAFVLIQSGMSSQKRNRAAAEVANIVAIIRDAYAEVPNMDRLPVTPQEGTSLLSDLNIVTTTPFGSATTYSVIRDVSHYNGADFLVQLRGLQNEDCVALQERVWSQAVGASCGDGVVALYFLK
jgi:hypothetical protein